MRVAMLNMYASVRFVGTERSALLFLSCGVSSFGCTKDIFVLQLNVRMPNELQSRFLFSLWHVHASSWQ